MSQTTEALEHAEHTAHSAHGDGGHGHGAGSNKGVGLTIAILGVLLALCAALVGARRTEMTKTMIEQTGAQNEYQAETTRYRSTLAQVEALDAVSPASDPDTEKRINAIGADVPPEQAALARALRQALVEQLNSAAPDGNTVARLTRLAKSYKETRAAARTWSKSFGPLIRAHYESAEEFEHAQLCAEIAIVIASIGLLLGNRIAWGGSILVGVAGIVIAAMTFTHARAEIAEGEHKIEEAKKHYDEVKKANDSSAEDEAVLKGLSDDDDGDDDASGSASAKPPPPADSAPKH